MHGTDGCTLLRLMRVTDAPFETARVLPETVTSRVESEGSRVASEGSRAESERSLMRTFWNTPAPSGPILAPGSSIAYVSTGHRIVCAYERYDNGPCQYRTWPRGRDDRVSTIGARERGHYLRHARSTIRLRLFAAIPSVVHYVSTGHPVSSHSLCYNSGLSTGHPYNCSPYALCYVSTGHGLLAQHATLCQCQTEHGICHPEPYISAGHGIAFS
eukprot:3753071-Rhodomonas_salina.1